MNAADARLRDRVFLKQTRDHRRIEIGPRLVDRVAIEVDDPAVSVVEPEPVLGRRQRMKLHDSLIILYEDMLDDELGPMGQNLVELFEGPRYKIGFRTVVTSERMCTFDRPINVVVYMFEETRTVAFLKPLEDPSNVVFCDHELLPYVLWNDACVSMTR